MSIREVVQSDSFKVFLDRVTKAHEVIEIPFVEIPDVALGDVPPKLQVPLEGFRPPLF